MNWRLFVKIFFANLTYCRCGQVGFSNSRFFHILSNLQKFLPTKISRYMVYIVCIACTHACTSVYNCMYITTTCTCMCMYL